MINVDFLTSKYRLSFLRINFVKRVLLCTLFKRCNIKLDIVDATLKRFERIKDY